MPRFTLTWIKAGDGEGAAFSGWRLYQEDQLVSQWADHEGDDAIVQRLAEDQIRITFGYRVTEWTSSPEGDFTANAEPL